MVRQPAKTDRLSQAEYAINPSYHLCEDLPRNDHDLQGLEWYVPRHALHDSSLTAHADLSHCHVRDDGDGQEEEQEGKNNRDGDTTSVVLGALAASEAQLFRIPIAADAAICERSGNGNKEYGTCRIMSKMKIGLRI